jgi:hypothetical protein
MSSTADTSSSATLHASIAFVAALLGSVRTADVREIRAVVEAAARQRDRVSFLREIRVARSLEREGHRRAQVLDLVGSADLEQGPPRPRSGGEVALSVALGTFERSREPILQGATGIAATNEAKTRDGDVLRELHPDGDERKPVGVAVGHPSVLERKRKPHLVGGDALVGVEDHRDGDRTLGDSTFGFDAPFSTVVASWNAPATRAERARGGALVY